MALAPGTSGTAGRAAALAPRLVAQEPLMRRVIQTVAPRGDVPGQIDHAAVNRAIAMSNVLAQARNDPGPLGVLKKVVNLSGVADVAKGLAGVTTGMGRVKNPRDLLHHEAGGALALSQIMPQTKGGGTAVAIATKAKVLRAALGLGNTGREVALSRKLAEAADVPMLQLERDARATLQNVVPEARAGHIQPGGIYKVPVEGRYSRHVQNRTAIIQDPETGTMFMAPGVIHGELIDAVAKQFPQFARRTPEGKIDFTKWLQHEVYAGEEIMPGVHTPPRWMVGPGKGIDTEEATIARARLIQTLQKIGALGDVTHAVHASQAQRARMLNRP